MLKAIDRKALRARRHMRIRSKIRGTEVRPRLCVYKSLTNIYAQIIDDTKGNTLVAASSLDKQIKDTVGYGGNVNAAKAVGQLIARKALEAGIKEVVFDRGGNIYHGRVSALAEGARETGLEF